MWNRSLLILFLFLTLPCKMPSQAAAIQIQVRDYAGLEPSTFQRFVARTQDILVNAGLSVQVEACGRGDGDPCALQTGSARRLQIRVLGGAPKIMRNVSRPPLGEFFADENGGAYASVFLQRATDEAAKANVPTVIVLAYATAHEVGHLLLGAQAHTPRGVMKAQWDRNDFLAMYQNNFHFNTDQRQQLTNRYGVPRPTDVGPNTALARTQ